MQEKVFLKRFNIMNSLNSMNDLIGKSNILNQNTENNFNQKTVGNRFNNYYLAVGALLLILLLLQYKIFFGAKNNMFFVLNLKKQISVQNKELEKLRNKNNKLALKIDFLKHNPLAYEEQARYELGMQKNNEIYYQVIVPVAAR